MTDKIITQEYLQSIFEYKNGSLYWKISPCPRVKIGNIAGSDHSKGYIKCKVFKKDFYVHRLIFLHQNGFLPKNIDHINGNKSDNRIENLRDCNQSQNSCNVGLKITNTSGYKNVSYNKKRKKWQVSIKLNNKSYFFGQFDNIELAKLAAKKARHKYHQEFARE